MRMEAVSSGENPCFRVIDHSNNRGDDLIISNVKLSSITAVQVATFHGEFQPDLCFRSFGLAVRELTDEGRLLATFSPCFSEIGTNAARRSPNLVRQRVDLFLREPPRQLKDAHRSIQRLPINLQIAMRLSFLSHPGTPSSPLECAAPILYGSNNSRTRS